MKYQEKHLCPCHFKPFSDCLEAKRPTSSIQTIHGRPGVASISSHCSEFSDGEAPSTDASNEANAALHRWVGWFLSLLLAERNTSHSSQEVLHPSTEPSSNGASAYVADPGQTVGARGRESGGQESRPRGLTLPLVTSVLTSDLL